MLYTCGWEFVPSVYFLPITWNDISPLPPYCDMLWSPTLNSAPQRPPENGHSDARREAYLPAGGLHRWAAAVANCPWVHKAGSSDSRAQWVAIGTVYHLLITKASSCTICYIFLPVLASSVCEYAITLVTRFWVWYQGSNDSLSLMTHAHTHSPIREGERWGTQVKDGRTPPQLSAPGHTDHQHQVYRWYLTTRRKCTLY